MGALANSKTQVKCCIMQHFNRVCTVCQDEKIFGDSKFFLKFQPVTSAMHIEYINVMNYHTCKIDLSREVKCSVGCIMNALFSSYIASK